MSRRDAARWRAGGGGGGDGPIAFPIQTITSRLVRNCFMGSSISPVEEAVEERHFILSFALQGSSPPLVSGLSGLCQKPEPHLKNQLIEHMKLAFIAAAAAFLAASCCPNPPAPSQPAYVAPSK
jgi:hypothetical protein